MKNYNFIIKFMVEIFFINDFGNLAENVQRVHNNFN